MRARFAVDFDGTICVDEFYPEIGPIIPGAKEGLEKLSRLGDVVIYTCRVAPFDKDEQRERSDSEVLDEIRKIEAFFTEHGMPRYPIWLRPYKPPAAAYIDNKGIHFGGDWEFALADVVAMLADRPYEKAAIEQIKMDMKRESELVDPNIEPGCCGQCGPEGCGDIEPFDDEPMRHPNSQRFVEAKMAEIALHDRKQKDYGTDEDPFANIRRCERYDIPAWVGCGIRMADKMARIERAIGQWARGEEVTMSNESLLDSFDDLSVYSTIGRVLFEDWSA